MSRFLYYFLIAYCFLFFLIAREIGGLPVGLFIDSLFLILLVAALFTSTKADWRSLNVDIFYLLLIWLVVSLLEGFNPGSSTEGWINEIRSTAIYPFFAVMLGLLVFKQNRDLDLFIIIVVGLSTLASINGFKQLYIGLTPGEQAFLRDNANTHLLWGRLRVFSFYSDAGQFGASQAHIGLMALIMALAPIKKWKRILLGLCGAINIYGMLISGTRGALFAIVIGGLVAIILSKNFKALFVGGLMAIMILSVLKFTHIGDSNYQIYRLRSALNPADASLNARFINQQNLKIYMADLPFGGGPGVTGYYGGVYNADKYLSTVPPDSYFVKIWMMYGVVGLTIWFCIMMYIIGSCCGMVWNIQDKVVKTKMIALTAGAAGILFCSYGNEVINLMPTSIVVYLSWVFIYKSRHFTTANSLLN
ncbi:O-antigen ligase family protein [Pedobacter sandarakinus]|uniref:O-antigen ligase family protein n=1 Tax=Pedobacter sandarakinus TaxID=353156 RepID=UPI0022465BE5|nr:O-antigen ligase family protein [Pedobacter sandarakinus]MCX2574874.1 O-antigen ligase family protein [Pedobacter sandarakinus]